MIVLSVPKSGRTWLRTFLCAYFCNLRGHDFTLTPERYGDPAIPRVIYSHDLFEHRTKGNVWDAVRGKYLVSAKELRRAKIVLLARDPRDVFVSILRDQQFGIGSIVKTMNDWLDEFSGRRNFSLLRYESLRATPAEQFRGLLALLGETTPNTSIFQDALDFSEFGNMQKLEAAGVFDSKILQARDIRDPESFKVRRGKIGGYEDYLFAEDRQYAIDALRELDAHFGYEPHGR